MLIEEFESTLPSSQNEFPEQGARRRGYHLESTDFCQQRYPWKVIPEHLWQIWCSGDLWRTITGQKHEPNQWLKLKGAPAVIRGDVSQPVRVILLQVTVPALALSLGDSQLPCINPLAICQALPVWAPPETQPPPSSRLSHSKLV